MGAKVSGKATPAGDACPIPGDILGWVGQWYEQPDLDEDISAHCREVGLEDH